MDPAEAAPVQVPFANECDDLAMRNCPRLMQQLIAGQQLLDQTSDTNLKGTLQKILDRRDAVISGLSKADAAVRTAIGSVVDELNQSIPVALGL